MARIVFDADIDSIRGSIQGTTIKKNQYGFSIQRKKSLVNPRPAHVSRSLTDLERITRHWRAMTDANRSSWETVASTLPIPSRHNVNIDLSGYAYFIRYHILRLLYNSLASSPVSDFLDSPGTATSPIGSGTFVLGNDAGDLLGVSESPASSSNYGAIGYSSAILPGPRETPIRLNALYAQNYIPPAPIDVTSIWQERYGSIPQNGDETLTKLAVFRYNGGHHAFFPVQRFEVAV